MILSEVLSPGFDLNSPIVRNVFRGWIAHGDVVALWITQPLALSTGSCLLEACHQGNVVGFFAGLSSDTSWQSLAAPTVAFLFSKCRWTCVLFGLPLKKRFTLFSVNAPIHMKLARRCDDHGNICSFSGKAHPVFKGHFLHRVQRLWFAAFIARALVHSFHAKDSWTNNQCWLG